MDNKMNLPNKLTILRIILVPIFILLLAIPESFFTWIKFSAGLTICRWLAVVVFAVAAFTDFLDGRISRKNNIVTKFGKIMDPLADKLLVSAGFIMLTGLGIVPAFVTAIVVFRDFFVNALRMFGADKEKDVAAGISGKIKTLFQMLTIVLGLIGYAYRPGLGVFAFIDNSLKLSSGFLGIAGVIINVGFSISLIGVIIATIYSFVDYFNRFKDDIDYVD